MERKLTQLRTIESSQMPLDSRQTNDFNRPPVYRQVHSIHGFHRRHRLRHGERAVNVEVHHSCSWIHSIGGNLRLQTPASGADLYTI